MEQSKNIKSFFLAHNNIIRLPHQIYKKNTLCRLPPPPKKQQQQNSQLNRGKGGQSVVKYVLIRASTILGYMTFLSL